MRLTCLQKNLSNALNITSKAVNSNNTLPVLNNVLIKAEGKKLYLSTTNLETAVSYWIDAEIVNEGEITIPSKLITNYINYLKDENVEISVNEGENIILKTKDSNTKIKGISSKEFPSIPNVEKTCSFSVNAKDFLLTINQVSFSAALNTTRPILTGVFFNIEKNKLFLATTDSYRLSEKKLDILNLSGELSCIVPVKTMLELSSIMSLVSNLENVDISISKNQILFSVGKVKITSRLIEGQFPNYKQVIPTENKTKINLNLSDLSIAIKRINLFAKENNNKVLIKVEQNLMSITTDNTQYGTDEVKLNVITEGDSAQIALNSQFILDVLSNINSKEVVIELNQSTNPAMIKASGRNDYVHIIMPLKI